MGHLRLGCLYLKSATVRHLSTLTCQQRFPFLGDVSKCIFSPHIVAKVVSFWSFYNTISHIRHVFVNLYFQNTAFQVEIPLPSALQASNIANELHPHSRGVDSIWVASKRYFGPVLNLSTEWWTTPLPFGRTRLPNSIPKLLLVRRPWSLK